MNMTNVHTFLRVVYSSSLTQAANELFVSQPTVTARLQQLEDEIGAVLIRRGDRYLRAPDVWIAAYPGRIPGSTHALAPPSFAVIPGKA